MPVDRRARYALLVLAVLAGAAALGPPLVATDPLVINGQPLTPPSAGHPFGTNDLGQDLFSQWLWATRWSLLVALGVAALSTALSWSVGLLAALWHAAAAPLVAVMDLLLALPEIPLYLLVVALLGPGRDHLVLTLGLLSWAGFGRVVRARVLAVRSDLYVQAAHALGATPLHIARCHVLPATLQLLTAKLVLTMRFALFAETTLAFLGLGDPSTPSWGTTLGWAFSNPLIFLTGAWTWWVLPPALSIVAVVLSAAALADAADHRRVARVA